jgi:predicted amidophosphoribosyltransferase
MPASLCPLPGPLYRVLMGYKEAPVDEARRQFARRVGDLFSVFLTDHRPCLETALGGRVDLVLPVPSSARPGRAPLERVDGLGAAAVAALGHPARWLPSALVRGTGAVGHMRPSAEAFAVPPRCRDAVRQARVVLLDDTYVSGSRAQSAAAALRLARARSVVIVPLGRVVRPERFATHAALVDRGPIGDGHRAACVLPQIRAAKG